MLAVAAVVVAVAAMYCEDNLDWCNMVAEWHPVHMMSEHRRSRRMGVVLKWEILVHTYFAAKTPQRRVRHFETRNCFDWRVAMSVWMDRGMHCYK